MTDLQKLIGKRATIKGQVTRFSNIVKSFDVKTSSIHELQFRVEKISDALDQFQEIQSEIESLPNQDLDDNERQAFEDSFFAALGLAKEIIFKCQNGIHTRSSVTNLSVDSNRSNNQLINPTNSTYQTLQGPSMHNPIPNSTSQNHNNNIAPKINIPAKVNLPTISLPSFYGHYYQWMAFSDTFTSLIHENEGLPDIQKFHYLQSCLKGEAAQVIHSLDISSKNYNIAWTMLKERYENRKLIIHTHVKTLFDLPGLKNESFILLRKLLDNFNKNLRALSALGQETETWDTLLVYILASKVDPLSKREWEHHTKDIENPTIIELTSFLTKRCQWLETLENKSKHFQKTNQSNEQNSLTHVSTNKISCSFCKGNHYNQLCDKLKSMSVTERISEVRKYKLCTNCLRPNHSHRDCRCNGCKICNKKHFTLLHNSEHTNSQFQNANDNSTNNTSDDSLRQSQQTSSNDASLALAQTVPSHSFASIRSNSNQIILATALVDIYTGNNSKLRCRAMLDSASQSNFISEELAKKLELKFQRINIPVASLNNCLNNISRKVDATITSIDGNFTSCESFLVINKITENLPQTSFDISSLNIPADIILADDCCNISSKINLLLGASIFFEILCGRQIKTGKNTPVLQQTKLGWILSGPMYTNHNSNSICHLSISNTDLNNQLERFWEIEEISNKFDQYSKEERECEEHFIKNFKRHIDGRFEVSLPLKHDKEKLGSSLENALRRFEMLERRFKRDPEFKSSYIQFMTEYEKLGHMKEINLIDYNPHSIKYYIPHHGVLKQDSYTTKLRVVFDASCKSTSGWSLNDILKVGPTIQPELFSIVLNFRLHNIVFTADCEKMYRQINIAPEDKDLQRIVWRTNPSESLKHYQLCTVVYGEASSSFLACRSLYQTAVDNENKYPKASSIIKNCFYVDDLISGAETVEEANLLKNQIVEILGSGKFHLRKWASNHPELLEYTSNTNFENLLQYISPGKETIKTLGLAWNPNRDIFVFKSNLEESKLITKRVVLSNIAKIFDPLGLIGPVVVQAKFILQKLWQEKIGWDDRIPGELFQDWSMFNRELTKLNHIEIPRQVTMSQFISQQIHGFCDSSQKAYGACVYLRSTCPNGSHKVMLMCAKSKIAPVKRTRTLPCLELCGATLLANLTQKVKKSLKFNHIETFYWCDSSIVISWIAGDPHNWKTFVANRVAEIHEVTGTNNWRYVPSQQNPADIISRGCNPEQLPKKELWWTGPEFLIESENAWPKNIICSSENIPEKRNKQELIFICYTDENIFDRYSSFTKTHRVFTYMLRFIHNLKTKNNPDRMKGDLTTNELEKSLLFLIKIVQSIHYANEIRCLKNNKFLPRTNKLLPLNPFLDSNDLLRVGGRLKNAPIFYDVKYPILLPDDHKFTNMLIQYEHKISLHAGPQAVLARLRKRYWIPNGKNKVRGIIRKCIPCFRARPHTITPMMGDLPKTRLTPLRPFSVVGIDFAGPILVKDGRLKTRKMVKTYICIFICFATKAVHIELASDLSTPTFLNCLKRFVSRRGLCSEIYSDNGSNFIGADNELKAIIREIKNINHTNEFRNFLLENRIKWHFNTPLAPHQGGLWEAAVKSAKKHLIRVVGNAHLTFEGLYTVLCQIEAVLNSRPLTPLSNDPSDPTFLTPAHFLLNDSLLAVPQRDVAATSSNRLDHYRRLQQILQHFWKRWSSEYVTSLQQRQKWFIKLPNRIKVGDLVVAKEDNSPPLQWKVGRVSEIHPGNDDVIRIVSVRTKNGVIDRSVSKVQFQFILRTEAYYTLIVINVH